LKGLYKEMNSLRLGVNIDHVATIRNARGGDHPDPVRAALQAQNAGADGITAHLREDRRHISDYDIERLKKEISLPLNLEMAATEEMLKIALKTKPNAACIVPEKRQEVTTEGGLNISSNSKKINSYTKQLQDAGIKVSLFLDPNMADVEIAKSIGVDIIEFHTGKYCHLKGEAQKQELQKLKKIVKHTHSLGVECHAGHGLSYCDVTDVAKIRELKELNIGHFLIGEAIFSGLSESILKMKNLIIEARLEE
jgi:pyridoxine 5-phosphate synthase